MRKKDRLKWLCIVFATIVLLSQNSINLFAETTDCIYFGSYPQTEVTDEAVIRAIDDALNTEEAQAVTGTYATVESGMSPDSIEADDTVFYDAGMGRSVWVDGVRYLKIGKEDVNQVGNFGTEKQYRYFEWEQIKWKILKNDETTMLVMADCVLDCKKYNEVRDDVTWENSTLRSWMNGYGAERNFVGIDYSGSGFLQNAFSKEEQKRIVQTEVAVADNCVYHTPGGNNTTDLIYLLSMDEVSREDYGFCENAEVSSVSRHRKASDFAYIRGCGKSTAAGNEGNCGWWLRSPGMYCYDAAYVNSAGYVNDVGLIASYDDIGVLPVMQLKVYSDSQNKKEEEIKEVKGDQEDSEKNQQIKVESLTILTPSKKLAAGKKVQLTAEIKPENATEPFVKWSSSNTKYATVSETGKVTLKKAGIGKNVTITAEALDGSGVKASCKIKIMKHAVKKVKIIASGKTVTAGKTLKLKATVTTTGKSANKALKWASSNEEYATVSKKGVVTAKKAGKGKTVIITAAATDGSGRKASVKVKIK